METGGCSGAGSSAGVARDACEIEVDEREREFVATTGAVHGHVALRV